MTAANDTKRGLRANVYATGDAVQKAIVNASDLLGKRSNAVLGTNKVTVRLQTTVVGVTHRSQNDGSIQVVAEVETYRTSQEKLFYFIPVGPKFLQNKRSLVTFLEALEQELNHIDSGKGSVQMVGPGAR